MNKVERETKPIRKQQPQQERRIGAEKNGEFLERIRLQWVEHVDGGEQ